MLRCLGRDSDPSLPSGLRQGSWISKAVELKNISRSFFPVITPYENPNGQETLLIKTLLCLGYDPARGFGCNVPGTRRPEIEAERVCPLF